MSENTILERRKQEMIKYFSGVKEYLKIGKPRKDRACAVCGKVIKSGSEVHYLQETDWRGYMAISPRYYICEECYTEVKK
jgi:hypothetical protein